jgi:nickel-dependent lactate racemase
VAINSPIGTGRIRELACGKSEVVIIFDDMSRVTRTAKLVPFILEELAAAGIPDSRIRFVCALGTHAALNRLDFVKKLGEKVLARFPVYNHNPFGNSTYVGTTRTYGTKVYINQEVIDCDFKIAIGLVVPHRMSGFGGGGKIILPGVASFETIEYNHRAFYKDMAQQREKPVYGLGVFDDNPLRLDIEEAATLAGLDVLISCLVNGWGETVAVFSGTLALSYAAAVKEAKAHYLTPMVEGKDIVIANTFTKANESWLGLSNAFRTISPSGGDVVLIANIPEGQVTHYLLGSFGKTNPAPLRSPVKIPQHINHLIVYSEYPDLAGRAYFEASDKVLAMSKWSNVLSKLREFHGTQAKVAVYPNAEIQYCASG